MSNVEYVGRVFNADKRSAASARSPAEDGPARALDRASSPRPVIRGERVRRGARLRTVVDARLPATGFVRLPTILALFPISRSSWWDGVRRGKYPAALKLGSRTTAWRADDIRALLERGGIGGLGTGQDGSARSGKIGLTAAHGRYP